MLLLQLLVKTYAFLLVIIESLLIKLSRKIGWSSLTITTITCRVFFNVLMVLLLLQLPVTYH